MKSKSFARGFVVAVGWLALACADADKGLVKDFLFGTAIAGFQAEMGCPTLSAADCEDPNSDLFAFYTSPTVKKEMNDRISGQNPSEVGPGFWELYEDDLDRVQNELSNNALRTSLEWSRIFPTSTEGVEGYDALKAISSSAAVAKYHAMFQAMRARGIEPVITINHYSLPGWIHDSLTCYKDFAHCQRRGWVDSERTIAEIAKFAGFVAREFGGVDGGVKARDFG